MPGLDERRDQNPDGVVREKRGGDDEDGQTRGAVVHGNQGGGDELEDE